jgi:hypothetical protein
MAFEWKRLEIITLMFIKFAVFWDMTPCSSIDGFQRCKDPPKYWYPTTELHYITSQKTVKLNAVFCFPHHRSHNRGVSAKPSVPCSNYEHQYCEHYLNYRGTSRGRHGIGYRLVLLIRVNITLCTFGNNPCAAWRRVWCSRCGRGWKSNIMAVARSVLLRGSFKHLCHCTKIVSFYWTCISISYMASASF